MDLEAIESLYEQGLYLQAYELGTREMPLGRWTGTTGRLLAARLAAQLGGHKLSSALSYLAYRENRRSPQALFYYGFDLMRRRGLLAAWEFVTSCGNPANAPAEDLAQWYSLHTVVLTALRDFDRAEDWLRRAEALAPQDIWLIVTRARLSFASDRVEAGLALAQEALKAVPWNPLAVDTVARALIQLDRQTEALEILREASERLERARTTDTLIGLLFEKEFYEEAEAALDRFEKLSPLLDEEGRRQQRLTRSDIAYYRGDLERARQLIADVNEGFHGHIRDRLAGADKKGCSVRLAVPYVRQDFLTCGPATLASIGQYWSMPIDHADLAHEMPFGGTPDHVERDWAETNGWVVREFKVDWDTTRTLIDRGIPFTLTTVEPTSGHLQAVIGYDDARQSVFIRDPGGSLVREALSPQFFDDYASTGPRGMALVPVAEAHRLEELQLPEKEAYSHLYQLKRALHEHRRDDAQRHYESLLRESPDHRLSLEAGWLLAAYDRDLNSVLRAIEGLLALYPDDRRLQNALIWVLRDLGRHGEVLDALSEIVRRPDVDPVFFQQYADDLRLDARRWNEAEAMLTTALSKQPFDPATYSTLAALRMDRGKVDEALELYRFAACLSPADEAFSENYFNASRICGKSDEALDFLRQRADRVTSRTSLPAQTLAWALASLERRVEAFSILDNAMAARPDDAGLRLRAAFEYGRVGDAKRADALLKQAQPGVRSGLWLRIAAELAGFAGRSSESLDLWREAAELEAFDSDLVGKVHRLTAMREGPESATKFLREAVERAPRNVDIGLIWVEWLRSRDRGESIRAAEALVDAHPLNARARRALAESLFASFGFDSAERSVREALLLNPNNGDSHALMGRIHLARGNRKEGEESLRAAIRLSVDTPGAIEELVQSCQTDDARREALDFVKAELQRQVVFGSGLAGFRNAARAVLEPEETAALLREALDARPDLWQAWSQLINQLLEMNEPDEALKLASDATDRFPLVADLWVDLANVHYQRSERPERRKALERASSIDPLWTWVHRELALLLIEQKDLAEARRWIERAIHCAPLESGNYGCRACVEWAADNREAAVESLKHAVTLEPGYDWGWQQLRAWSSELERPDEAAQLAEKLVAERPEDVRCWLAVAHESQGPEKQQRRIDALQTAARLEPLDLQVDDELALELSRAGRFDEALAACHPPWFQPTPPLELRGRAAWIEAQRGRPDEAIRKTRELVEEHPGYLWGWWNITDWAAQAADWVTATEAAEYVTRMMPGDSFAWFRLGYVARRRGGGAKLAHQAYERALSLDPQNYDAALELSELKLDDHDVKEAIELLDNIEAFAPRDRVLAGRVAVACWRDDREAAFASFEQLCAMQDAELEPIIRASEFIDGAGWKRDLHRILDRSIESETPSRGTLRLYGDGLARRRLASWRQEARFVAACQRVDAGIDELCNYLEQLANYGRKHRLRRLIAKWREFWAENALLWGTVGFALLLLRRYSEVQSWMSDWRKREEVQPWMLLNLALALRHLDDWVTAGSVSRHALDLPDTFAQPEHACWLALDAALAGKIDEASELLRLAASSRLQDDYRHLYSIVQLLIDAHRAATPEAMRTIESTSARLQNAPGNVVEWPGFRLAHERAMHEVARISEARAS